MTTVRRDERLYTRFLELKGNITMAKLGKEFKLVGSEASRAIDKAKENRRKKKEIVLYSRLNVM